MKEYKWSSDDVDDIIRVGFCHFKATGWVQITLWGGGSGTIDMEEFELPDPFTKKDIVEGINDNGFGCQSIDRAEVDIYAVYDAIDVHIDRLHFTENELHKSKRGI